MALGTKFRDRVRVTSIQADDIFPLSRMVGGAPITYSISWASMSSQIMAEIDAAGTWMTAECSTLQTHIDAANTAMTNGLSGKEPTISAGTAAQYWRGDKTWQTLNKSAVGLSNVDNTTDAGKPVSTAQQAALDGKLNAPGSPTSRTLVFGTAYQASTPAKSALLSVMIDAAYSLTIAGTLADTVELRIGPVSTTVADGTGGIAIATFRASLTGIALTIGLGNGNRNQLSALLPAGWYFAVRRVAGTTATISSAFDQAI